MAKPAAPAVVSAVDLEKDATDLNLHTLHKDFFVIPKTLKTDSNCDPLEKQQKGAKNLCNSAVHFVKELSGKQGTENYRRCKYLPYWLHDEIGKLYKEHNKNIDSIPFIKPLIEAVDKATKTITNDKCNSLHYDGSITLDEWKARKLLYIYFKNFDELSREVSRPSNDKCSKHNKYLNSINSLYKTYYKKLQCNGWLSFGRDYFYCSSLYDPNRLLPKVTCKDQSTSRSTGFSFWPFGGGSSSSRSSSSSQVGTRQAVSASVPKGGPSTPVAGSTGALSAQGAKLIVVQIPKPVDSATVGRLDAAGTLSGRSAYPNQPVQLQLLSKDYPVLPTPPESSASSPDFLKKTYGVLKSDYFRYSVMGASAIGALIFLYLYLSPSRSGSSKREHGKKKHKSVDYCDYNDYGDYDNHDGDGKYDDDVKHDDHDNRDKYDDNAGYGDYDSYDEYEEELSRRGPENSHRDRQRREVRMSYQPRRDSYY
ncbi:unnamed protein product [Plasmodium vivax]|uniref:(malaria parasite P. vivax) hypothetical protein n=1 Tax=Plasmodium vivax TaxID=5855 RepID=A0A8S4HE97_PLAVI|nr:unnamed protein product [Plasmodium vivax]